MNVPERSTSYDRALLAAIAALLCASPSFAYEPSLTPAEIRGAMDAGGAAAHAHRGFDVAAYTLYSVRDALSLEPGAGLVDAVVVGTPYERVAYAAYESTVEQRAPEAAQVRAASAACSIDFIVFGHSASSADRAFLTRYSHASVKVGNAVLAPRAADEGRGATLDTFLLPNGGNEDRWIGHVAFRFDLCALPAAASETAKLHGMFSFEDSGGTAYSLPFDLARYR